MLSLLCAAASAGLPRIEPQPQGLVGRGRAYSSLFLQGEFICFTNTLELLLIILLKIF